jgi:hypothetical protein
MRGLRDVSERRRQVWQAGSFSTFLPDMYSRCATNIVV